jgi:beta-galactosidase
MPVESETPIRLMLANLGVKFDNSIHESKRAVDVNGNVIRFKEDPDGISFWMFSPRSLTDLLSEPDIPKLSLKIQNAKNFKIKLNMDKKAIPEANIPLERGWNKITITFKENVEENIRNIKLNFKTDQPEFFKEIDSMIER